MGIMIKDQEIIDALTELADRRGTTKAQALHDALLAEWKRLGGDKREELFPRDRVTYRTYSL